MGGAAQPAPSESPATAGAAQGPLALGPEDQAEEWPAEWQAAPSFVGRRVGGNRAPASTGQGTAGVRGELEWGWWGACSGGSWP